MTKVYVVEGSTGEYSDHREWPVAAYMREDLAREHADKAKKWYLKLYQYESTPKTMGLLMKMYLDNEKEFKEIKDIFEVIGKEG